MIKLDTMDKIKREVQLAIICAKAEERNRCARAVNQEKTKSVYLKDIKRSICRRIYSGKFK